MPEDKIVVLDRDGVINFDSDEYIKSADEWTPIPGSLEAIASLKQAGYRVAIATNQSGLARGYYSLLELNAMHNKMHSLLHAMGASVDFIAYCPHLPSDGCDCRKPAPGLLKQIGKALDVDLSSVWFIGDSLRDIEAAKEMGMQGVLVATGNGLKILYSQSLPKGVPVYKNLQEAANALLAGA